MTQPFYFLVLLSFFQSCASPAAEECESCDHDGTAYEILRFESTVAFDTVTVVIEGVISDLENEEGIYNAELILGGDTAYTNEDGYYRFYHINGGKSAMTIKDQTGRLTKVEELDFENGKAWELDIAVSRGLD